MKDKDIEKLAEERLAMVDKDTELVDHDTMFKGLDDDYVKERVEAYVDLLFKGKE